MKNFWKLDSTLNFRYVKSGVLMSCVIVCFYPSFFNFVRGIGHREVLLEIDFAFENEKFSCIGREGLLRKVGMDLS